ncbi:MAG: helix-turn-helix domain-containing protein [Alphaproteobacteria bacterium]|nr:helix-turn-helix domain-containing protein [Alphaproteobacteria bacterium]
MTRPVPIQTTHVAPADYDGKHLLSVEDAAAFLSLSRATLNKWRVHGGGPEFVRIGRRIFYRQATLEAFVAAKTFPHTSAYDRV